MRGGILPFWAVCQILKIYGTLKISPLSYTAISHKPILISSGKKVKKCVNANGPLVLSSAWMAVVLTTAAV